MAGKQTAAPRAKLHASRRGYMLDGRFIEGFPLLPELGKEDRLRVARWAKRLRPRELTDEHRRVLAEAGGATGRPQRVVDELAGYSDNLFDLQDAFHQHLFEELSANERRWVREPATHPAMKDRGYPLTTGGLSKITGASERQIRHWADIGLLPSHRVGEQRRFFSAGLVKALVLARTEQYQRAGIAALVRGGDDAARFARLMGATLIGGAGSLPKRAREELAAAGETLMRHSRLLRNGLDGETRRAKRRSRSGASRSRRQ